MKIRFVLGVIALTGWSAATWAGPHPELMNSVQSQLREARELTARSAPKPAHKFNPWLRTRNITAGQSTVSVPTLTGCEKRN